MTSLIHNKLQIKDKLFLTVLLVITILLLPSHSAAENITITNTGIYELVPVQEDNAKESGLIALKRYSLVEKTTEIPAQQGTSFGFEFTADTEYPVSTVLKIIHPKIISSNGIGYTTIHTFPVIIKPGKKHFAGWNFTNKSELQPGKWIFEFNYPGSPVCEFQIVPVKNLIYDGSKLTESPLEQKQAPELESAPLPYGDTLERFLVRGGIFPSLNAAEKYSENVRNRGYVPFIFLREKKDGSYWYYLFIKMFDTRQEAESFAAEYRKKYNKQAIPQKIQIKLAPM